MLAIALVASTARADDGDVQRSCKAMEGFEHCSWRPVSGVEQDEFHESTPQLHLAGDVGFEIGALHYDSDQTLLVGVAGSVGVAYGRFALLADLADESTSAPQPVPLALARDGAIATSDDTGGELRRLGLRARIALTRHLEGDDDGVAEASWFVDFGAGREHVDWNVGGVLDRDDVVLGIGARAFSHAHRRGAMLELSTIVTRRYNDGVPMCGGPCQMATLPSSIDRSIVVDLRYVFGG